MHVHTSFVYIHSHLEYIPEKDVEGSTRYTATHAIRRRGSLYSVSVFQLQQGFP